MTPQEYENKIILAKTVIDGLIAVLKLMDENYFQAGFEGLGEAYWKSSYDDLGNTILAILTRAERVKGTLTELSDARLNFRKEAQE